MYLPNTTLFVGKGM